MTMKIVAFQIDTPDKLTPKSDTSLLLSLELQKRGFSIFFFQPDKIFTKNYSVFSRGSFVNINLNEETFIETKSEQELDLSSASMIFIRQNPPFDLNYITSLYLLKLLENKVPIINSPSAILANSEKFSPLLFPEYIPPTSITSSEFDIATMLKQFTAVILKPLYGHGGSDIIKITTQSQPNELRQFLNKHKYVVAQEFLPKVASTDKRVFICCGKIIDSFTRIPAQGMIAANLAAGGTAVATKLTTRETEISEAVAAWSLQQKLYLVGLDLVDEKLIEINVTSPTGIATINTLYGQGHEERIITLLEL